MDENVKKCASKKTAKCMFQVESVGVRFEWRSERYEKRINSTLFDPHVNVLPPVFCLSSILCAAFFIHQTANPTCSKKVIKNKIEKNKKKIFKRKKSHIHRVREGEAEEVGGWW